MQRQQASAYSQDDIAKIAEVYQIYVSALIGVVIWDWVLNLPRERKLIWKARWSVGKVAYLFVRYMTTVLGVICKQRRHAQRMPCAWQAMGREKLMQGRCFSHFGRHLWQLHFVSLQQYYESGSRDCVRGDNGLRGDSWVADL